ncbi:hypothetical protein LTSEWAN_3344 [Salmonella enterica subsp. enterica serovar Wandsworth str. A4-580]|uniref:Uncharacterized protein n=3 Tax=Salmonella enterica I TaxID=59201 RepID=A0A6C6YZ79_SALPB|nr:hypothetical protein SPAB_01135 [Salmonella enterica subsp. enterica serovar Paratyphi B str. SPB7]EHC93362.1 hypothetical protein LTSEUGA_1710 [Salmonella enterica subsp. enterica serovar Uganda str. R8-3404]EHD02002.1 hypothetical protein LTSEWAN_3344 [Salmonella enterica subsp. enterica serovar Wandsworth str. A4-580]VGM91659.1 hypothetical protein UPM517_3975 [Salmonella enterica subsp. enterica serovar Stanley]
MAFSGLALFPLTTLYLYLAFSFYWRNHQQKYRNAAPEAC